MDRDEYLNNAYRELQQPDVTSYRLRELAVEFPELHPFIIEHPAVYPELRDWLVQQCPAEEPVQFAIVQPSPTIDGVAGHESPSQLSPEPEPEHIAKPEHPSEQEHIPELEDIPEAEPEPELLAESNLASVSELSTSPPDPTVPPAPTRPSRASRVKAFGAGLGLGLVVGGALSAALILWVLPGLFGSIIG